MDSINENDTLSVILDELETKDTASLKKIIIEMTEVMDKSQLESVITAMYIPYQTQRMKEYLVDGKLPKLGSQEFLFLDLSMKNHGTITKKAALQAGVSPYSFYRFVEKYPLREIVKGIYVFENKPIDGLYLFQLQYSKAVVSHESALYYLGLSDVIQKEKKVSFPQNYNLTQLLNAKDAHTEYRDVYPGDRDSADGKGIVVQYAENDPIRVVGNRPIEKRDFIEVDSGFGHMIKVTTMERSIADLFSPQTQVEDEIIEVAIRRYLNEHDGELTTLRRRTHSQGAINLSKLDKFILKHKI